MLEKKKKKKIKERKAGEERNESKDKRKEQKLGGERRGEVGEKQCRIGDNKKKKSEALKWRM